MFTVSYFIIFNSHDKSICNYSICKAQTYPRSLVQYVSGAPEGNYTSSGNGEEHPERDSNGDGKEEKKCKPDEELRDGECVSLPDKSATTDFKPPNDYNPPPVMVTDYNPPGTPEPEPDNKHNNDKKMTSPPSDYTPSGEGKTVPSNAPASQKGGGCLIATSEFGSELSPQVQFLRNFRDNRILSTDFRF